LELYLNDLFLGQNTYGVVAAAQRYFGKTLEELTSEEAAYLAALPKAPSDLHPVRQYDRAMARRNYVLEEMAQTGHLSRADAEATKQRPLETIIGKKRPQVLANARPSYFSQAVRSQLIDELSADELYEGGLTIRATIDPELQEIAARALRRGLEEYDRNTAPYRGPVTRIAEIADGDTASWREQQRKADVPRDIPDWHPAVVLNTGETTALVGIEALEGGGTARLKLATEKQWIKNTERDGEKRGAPRRPSDLWQKGDVILVAQSEDGDGWTMRQVPEMQGAFMAMDPFSGRVLAIQGGFSFESSVFDRATQAERQPGSAFKPLVYAAALDAGYTPATVVLDAPVIVRQRGQADWRPKNSSRKFYVPSPMRLGLEKSRNVMTVRLAQAIGMDMVADYAERFGVCENMPRLLSCALGAGETTLYNMVAAYGMFANGGKRVRPTVVDRVQDRFGHTLFRHDPRVCQGCRGAAVNPETPPMLFDQRAQIMDPVTAYQLVSMMQGVVRRGTAARTVGAHVDFPVAGKTGTTNESRDAWFIGFTSNMVAGCYIGFDNPETLGRRAYGGTLCRPVFAEFINEAMKTRTLGEFREPADRGLAMVKMDRETGERLPDDAEGDYVIIELFLQGTHPDVYTRVSALSGDDALFAGMNALRFGIDATDLPFDEESAIQDPRTSTGTITAAPSAGGQVGATASGSGLRPAPPKPPSSGSLGMGTGGLY